MGESNETVEIKEFDWKVTAKKAVVNIVQVGIGIGAAYAARKGIPIPPEYVTEMVTCVSGAVLVGLSVGRNILKHKFGISYL